MKKILNFIICFTLCFNVIAKEAGKLNVKELSINDAFTLPTSDGSTDQILKTDGTGGVSWVTPASLSSDTLDDVSERGGTTDVNCSFTGNVGISITNTVTAGDLTVDSNIVNLSDTTDEYVLAFDTATNTWRGVEDQNTTYTAGNDIDFAGTQIDLEPTLNYVSTITKDSGNLTLSTTTSGNIIADAIGAVKIGGDVAFTDEGDGGGTWDISDGFLIIDFNDDTTNLIVVDTSTNTNNGVASDNTDTLSVAGKVSTALSFNGTDEFVTFTDIPSYSITDFGFIGWIYPIALATNDQYVGKWDYGSGDREWYIATDSADPSKITFSNSADGSSSGTCDSIAGVLNVGTWVHVAFGYTAGNTSGQWYVNSVAVANSGSPNLKTSIHDGGSDIYIAKLSQSLGFNNCITDGFVFLDRVPTQAEVTGRFALGVGSEALSKAGGYTDKTGLAISAPNSSNPIRTNSSGAGVAVAINSDVALFESFAVTNRIDTNLRIGDDLTVVDDSTLARDTVIGRPQVSDADHSVFEVEWDGIEAPDNGATNTGLGYDHDNKRLIVSLFRTDDDGSDDAIWILNADDLSVFSKIELDNTKSNDIQGNAYDGSDSSIWYGDFAGQDLRHMNYAGTILTTDNLGFAISGVAYDETNDYICVVDTAADSIKRYDASTTGPITLIDTINVVGSYDFDGLAFDDVNDLFYVVTEDDLILQVDLDGLVTNTFAIPTWGEGAAYDPNDGHLFYGINALFHAGTPKGNRHYKVDVDDGFGVGLGEVNLLGTRVGIGTNSPDEALEISGSGQQLYLSNKILADTDGARESGLAFVGSQSGAEKTMLASITAEHDGAADDQKGRIHLNVNDGDDDFVPTNAITILSDGNVGIGTTSPNNLLDINSHLQWDDTNEVLKTQSTTVKGSSDFTHSNRDELSETFDNLTAWTTSTTGGGTVTQVLYDTKETAFLNSVSPGTATIYIDDVTVADKVYITYSSYQFLATANNNLFRVLYERDTEAFEMIVYSDRIIITGYGTHVFATSVGWNVWDMWIDFTENKVSIYRNDVSTLSNVTWAKDGSFEENRFNLTQSAGTLTRYSYLDYIDIGTNVEVVYTTIQHGIASQKTDTALDTKFILDTDEGWIAADGKLAIKEEGYFGGNVGIGINLPTDVINPLTVIGTGTFSGNLGVGISNPTVALDVVGAGALTGNLTVLGNVGLGIAAPSVAYTNILTPQAYGFNGVITDNGVNNGTESNGDLLAKDELTSLSGWSQASDNTGTITAVTFDGESTFKADGFTNDAGIDYVHFYKVSGWSSDAVSISFGIYMDEIYGPNGSTNTQGAYIFFPKSTTEYYKIFLATNGFWAKMDGGTYYGAEVYSSSGLLAADTWYDITYYIDAVNDKITIYLNTDEVILSADLEVATSSGLTPGEIKFGSQAIQSIPCYYNYIEVGTGLDSLGDLPINAAVFGGTGDYHSDLLTRFNSGVLSLVARDIFLAEGESWLIGNVGIGITSVTDINNRLTVIGSADISGNLGIGIANPIVELDVVGDMNLTGDIIILGSVGIGTTALGATLDVGGGTATSIDGTDDLLVKDDAEIDGDLYVEGTTTLTDAILGSTNAIYFGGATTEGSWRIIRSGNNLAFERYESSAWVEKGAMAL